MDASVPFPKQWSEQAFTFEKMALFGAQFLGDGPFNKLQMARRLVCIACDLSKSDLIKLGNQCVNQNQKDAFMQVMIRFLANEPLSRIEGIGSFYGYDFLISPDVLDPRPETELLIECLKKSYVDNAAPLKIMDIGTGSGCLAVISAMIYPNASITAIDICPKALNIARQNAQKYHLDHRIDFIQSNDELSGLTDACHDIILFNPPYISEETKPYLDSSVRDYDPSIALFDHNDGLDFYRLLNAQIINYLKKKGSIFLEFGIGQARCVKNIFSPQNHGQISFESFKDDHGIIRAAHIQYNTE